MKPSLLSLIAFALAATPVLADEHRARAPENKLYQAECGSCHLAYPPPLLPAPSWRAVMGGLDKHFGTDASLDPKAAAEITRYLEQYAGRDRRGGAQTVLRISETRWFVHEHDEVSAATWKNPKVKGAFNCAACHPDAARGDFNEHRVRMPR